MKKSLFLLFYIPLLWAGIDPGDLDSSFGKNGIVFTDFGDDSTANSVVIQADGKLVAAGNTGLGPNLRNFALARYNSDGSRDSLFGNDGIVFTDFGDNSFANSVVVQADGKLVAAGRTSSGPNGNDFALARYNSDGSRDSSFGNDGIVFTDFGNDSSADSVAVQADGKLVAAGNTDNSFALVRYNSDGSRDSSFGNGGLVILPVESVIFDVALAIQPDGKLVLGVDADSPDGFLLTRLNNDGLVDTSFGNNGFVLTDIITGEDDLAFSIATQADGKLVVAGQDGNNNFVLVRYLNNVVTSKVAQALFAKYSLFPLYRNRQSPNPIA